MFVVEDGTGLSNAQSYVSVAGADTYWTLWGGNTAWAASSTAEKEASLRLATRWLDDNYHYYGELLTIEQALNYPRSLVYSPTGRVIGGTGVLPPQLLNACIEVAAFYRANGLTSPSDVSAVKREKIGDSEVEYAGAAFSATQVKVERVLVDIALPKKSVFLLRRV